MTGPGFGTTRRDFIVRGAQLAAVLGIGAPLLQACGGDDDSEGASEPIDDGLEPEAGPLRVFNYADYVNPDVVAVGGRGLEAYRPGRQVLARSYARASALPALPLTFSSFGEGIGDAGALGASLSAVYTDPVATLGRRAARPSYDPAADRFCG